MMDEKNVHVMLNSDESLDLRKELLNFQADLIEMMKTRKRHELLRKEELKLKAQARKALKEVNSDILHINRIWPKPEMPKIARESGNGNADVKGGEDVNLETQLEEIKKKLESLS